MFIKPDEFILLIEDQDGGRYQIDDLKRLRDAGIQTIVRTPFWSDIETSAGYYGWANIDNQVAMTRAAGLKCMFAVYDKAPAFFPDDCYLKNPDGSIYAGSFYDHVISPWSSDGWRRHIEFIQRFCDRFSGDDVLCFRATIHGGEVMLPEYAPFRQDGPLLETMAKMFVDEQTIFNAYRHHELFTSFHHAFDHVPYSGTAQADTWYSLLRDSFPQSKHYAISYTQFRGDVVGEDRNLADMQRLGLSMFAGSEYCEGLNTNTDRAIAEGFRGFVTAPLHFHSGHRGLEPWMLDAIKNSLAKWRNARV